ncbi:S-layer homology domain [Candidatus Syntrophocurvum alkaliphilum]|uniref:S-layer homology domain n=1 Tax=Candidatus Syntrophocurvum alkaliphilum TaxID=2293317 RepID=A0A6I6DDY6_9FIRM|nr:S-layer homology domain-containing protein [Candidatus Syntrophocurvum alkaliphilum]QGU00692.1 S-layer homology domain [Candidatus Syntrophocurvum alkaliphilum]
MRKFLALILIIGLIIIPMPLVAAPLGFSGGVNDEYEYSEVIFISGEPIKMTGTYTKNERMRGEEKSINYRFNLSAEDRSIDASLDRRATYTITYKEHSDKGQTIADTEATTMRETINIGSDRYVLDDYQFSKSEVIDNRPAADFYSGTLNARKTYDINRGEGRAVIETSGGTVGYENFWGSTETQIIDYIVNVEREIEGEDDEDEGQTVKWDGTYNVSVSDSMSKSIRYSDNQATHSTFDGGHMRVTNSEMVSRYEYNLPRMNDNIPNNNSRIRGEIELDKQKLPKIERLILPKFRDIGGHWAEEDIKKLYSLDVFKDDSQFFLPDVPMSRMDFTRAIIRSCDIEIEDPEENTRFRRQEEPEESPFVDIQTEDSNYLYVREALNRGIINGVSEERFDPDGELTRAQAIVILIRVLGFEHNAPTPGYYTNFNDDAHIPDWAKDSIYVASEIGLVQGDSNNRINPNQTMTRAEASTMIIRFLNFLESDLQQDYREQIILYN